MTDTSAASLALPRRLAVVAITAGVATAAAALLFARDDMKAAGVVLGLTLAWMSAIDVDRFILPDVLTLGLLLTGMGFAILLDPGEELDRAIGAIAGYAVLGLVAFAYRRMRGRDGLGMGDAKLFAAAGAWLGWRLLPLVMLVASAAAILWVLLQAARGQKLAGGGRLPFGPFIALGFWGVWMSQAV